MHLTLHLNFSLLVLIFELFFEEKIDRGGGRKEPNFQDLTGSTTFKKQVLKTLNC